MAEPAENTHLVHEHKWKCRYRWNWFFLHWSWDVSKRSLIKNVACKNEHFYSWDYLGAPSKLSWFSLNEKSIEVKTEPVNFSRGSGIVPHLKVMMFLHLRAFSILTSEQQTWVLIKQPQQPSFSLQKSDIILLLNHCPCSV